MWKGCWSGTVLVALSRQIIVTVDPSVSEFEGMIQRFEVTATGMNPCGTQDTDREHCPPIAWLFLAYKAVIHDGGHVRGGNGAFILQNCPFACWQATYHCSMITTAFVSLYVTPIYLWLILYWVDRLLYGTGRLKTSYIWSCCAVFCMGTLMRSWNLPVTFGYQR